MGIIVPLHAAQCVIKFSLSGDIEPMVTTIGLGPLPEMDAEDAAQQVAIALTTPSSIIAAGNLQNDYTYQGVTAYKQTGTGFSVGSWGAPVAGNVTSPTAPSNCALLVKKTTSLGGRKHRGRMYWPPALYSADNLSPTGQLSTVATLQARFTVFFDLLVAAEAIGPPCVFHSDGAAATLLTGLVVDGVIATQRNRMR